VRGPGGEERGLTRLRARPSRTAAPAFFEVRTTLENEDGAPLAGGLHEIHNDGETVVTGRTGEKGELAHEVSMSEEQESVMSSDGSTSAGPLQSGAPAPEATMTAAAPGTTAVMPEEEEDDPVARHGRAAWHCARLEIARGVQCHGAGQPWETAGTNRGPMVDEYLGAFQSPASEAPWCGMFVGYSYMKAGFKRAGQLPASLTTDGRPVPRKTMFLSAARMKLYLEGADCPRIELPPKSCADQFTTRSACAEWLDRNLASFGPRPGDIVLFRTSRDYTHVGMVASYDPATYELVTYEGNYGNRASAWRWDLADPSEIGFFRINMIGRLRPDDFEAPCDVPPEGPSPDPTVEQGALASAR